MSCRPAGYAPFQKHFAVGSRINTRKSCSGDSLRTLTTKMPPVAQSSAAQKAEDFIKNNKIAVFSKSYCPFCIKVGGVPQIETFS